MGYQAHAVWLARVHAQRRRGVAGKPFGAWLLSGATRGRHRAVPRTCIQHQEKRDDRRDRVPRLR